MAPVWQGFGTIEVLEAAVAHTVTRHQEGDTAELRSAIQGSMVDAGALG